MTDISTVPDEQVADAPSEAPYVEPVINAGETISLDAVTAEPAEPAEPAATSAPEAAEPPEPTPTARRPRTELEVAVKDVTDRFTSGTIHLGEGETLTPHRISRLIEKDRGDDSKVSTGAVASVLTRWSDYGFAVVSGKPVAFVDYTDAGREDGLTALKAASATKRKADKAAIKAAEAPVAPVPPEASA